MSAAEKISQFPIQTGRWVRGSLLMAIFGISEETARKYRERGIWLEGRQWCKDPVGRVVYNPSSIDDWFEGKL